MRIPAAVVVFVAALLVAAIPGPCAYDEHEELNCVGEGTPCGDRGGTCSAGLCVTAAFSDGCSGSGCAQQCQGDNDCGFLGPDARCEGGACVGDVPCSLGEPQGPCRDFGQSCAYDPTPGDPSRRLNEGVCRPEASPAQQIGQPCPADVVDFNPCGAGGFCLPIDDGRGLGLCVSNCDPDNQCDGDLRCASLFFTGVRPMCVPRCNLDAPDCSAVGPDFVCAPAFGGCSADNGACVLAHCDENGCRERCNDTTPCADGFCLEQRIDNCRIDGRDQVLSTCQPPAAEGQPCDLEQPESCASGFACSPNAGDTARCVQQASVGVVADGGACNPNDFNINRCEKGSYCARSTAGGPAGGVCMSFCADFGDCDASETCVPGNVGYSTGGPEPGRFADVSVCAASCTSNSECGDLRCDVDNDGSCSGAGFCLPPEGNRQCFGDVDCTNGEVCDNTGPQRTCVLPADRCL